MKQKPDPQFFSTYESIAGYVQLARDSLDMNQAEFADFCTVSISTIQSLESPKIDRTCTLDTLLRIARALQVDVNDLLKFSRPKVALDTRQEET